MEGPQIKTPEKAPRLLKVEHFPRFDVVVNLDSDPKLREKAFDYLKPLFEKGMDGWKILSRVESLHPNYRFIFIKWKDENVSTEEKMDFMKGRTEDDFLHENVSWDFDDRARYALISVLNELAIAPEIKKLAMSQEFQGLAREYNFQGMKFAEPILAYVDKDTKERFLVYENIKGFNMEQLKRADPKIKEEFTPIANKFRALFLKNGIEAHDLRWSQFMVTKDKDLVLIDVEAYTKARNK